LRQKSIWRNNHFHWLRQGWTVENALLLPVERPLEKAIPISPPQFKRGYCAASAQSTHIPCMNSEFKIWN
jgi:hypothetical protein